MAASSVTGRGPGESHGLQKRENHCGCACGGPVEETTSTPPAKIGCVTKHVSNNRAKYSSNGGNTSIKVC